MTKKDFVQTGKVCLVFTVIVAAALTFIDSSHWIINIRYSFVYSFCIGTSISIFFHLFSRRLEQFSPILRSGTLFVFVLMGGLIGTEIGTIILRTHLNMEGHLRLLLFNLFLALVFGGIALLYFSLRASIQRMTEKLQEQARIKEEMDLARKIQQGLFPKVNPQIPNLDITGMSVSATTVGGDYYDFIQIGPQKILAVVADVSGKGMSAALYMSKIQGMVQLAAHMYKTPKEMLININRRIFDGLHRKSFITTIFALFDMEAEEVRICRAGHNKALVAIDGKIQFLEGKGIGLGLERGPIFENALEEVQMPVRPDGLFLFYTDGITEAMNEKNQQFGENAVLEVLKTNRHSSAERIQQEILSTVEQFRGSAEQHDDVTMVVVKVKFVETIK